MDQEEFIIGGVLCQIKKLQYCFYVKIRDHHRSHEITWVYEPEIWRQGPMRKAAVGTWVVCRGVKEIPAVSMRGKAPPALRYRATSPLEVGNEQENSMCNVTVRHESGTSMHERYTQQRPQHQDEHVIHMIRNVIKQSNQSLRLVKYGYWYCFDVKTLAGAVPTVSVSDLARCTSTLVRNGELACVDSREELFTLITHESFLAPALLMVLHGGGTDSVRIDKDQSYTMDEWIEAAQQNFLQQFHIPYTKLRESAHVLISQHYAVVTETGKYRRPYHIDSK